MKNRIWASCGAALVVAGVMVGVVCISMRHKPEGTDPSEQTGISGALSPGETETGPGQPEQSEQPDRTGQREKPGQSGETEKSPGQPDRAEQQEKPGQSGETEKAPGQPEQPGHAGQATPGGTVEGAEHVRIDPKGGNILTRIDPPEGFSRVEAEGFAAFLREYPLLEDGAPVLLHDGRDKWTQGLHVAVFDMPLVQGDLQQCADSCIRLYAEYFYGKGSYDRIAFHLVNGFLVDFDTWRKGGRVSVDGNKTEWVMTAEPSDSQETFEKYLRFVFTYASTLSMDRESEEIDLGQVQAGDLFIKGGSPGHVVMVLDVCESEDGDRAFLLGQGYMPAQQFHILKNPAHDEDPWYYVSEVTYPFETPEYFFSEGSFKRPVYDRP